MSELRLDHLVFTAPDLSAGSAELERWLGVPLSEGGEHEHMGTHNRLLSLHTPSGRAYLEVIAVDPAAAPISRPRWFGLDQPPAQLTLAHWVVQYSLPSVVSQDAELSHIAQHGEVLSLSRGHYQWRLTVPADGKLPLGGVLPSGVHLQQLTLHTPTPEHLLALLRALGELPAWLRVLPHAQAGLSAQLHTPKGPVVLGQRHGAV